MVQIELNNIRMLYFQPSAYESSSFFQISMEIWISFAEVSIQSLPFSGELLQKRMISESLFITSSEAEIMARKKVQSEMEYLIWRWVCLCEDLLIFSSNTKL